jgi:hypothetical protein
MTALTELKKLAELQGKATEGPWMAGVFQDTGFINQRSITPVIGCVYGDESDTDANAEYIAASRNIDLPALVAYVEGLEWSLHYLIERADDSNDARYGTLSAGFVRDVCSKALEGTE